MPSDLVTRQARVVHVDAGSAWVELVDTEGCGGCQARSSCGVGLLGRVFRRSPSRFLVPISEPMVVGDHVTLGLRPSALLIASLLGFGLPLLGLLLGSAAGASFASDNPDPAALIGGLAGLLVGLALVRWRFHRSRGDARFQPVLVPRR